MSKKTLAITDRVTLTIAHALDTDHRKIRLDDHLVNDLAADSANMGEIILDLEEEFGISISEEEAENCCTVKQIAKLVGAKLAPVPGTRWYIVYLDNDPNVLGLVELKINNVPLDHKPYGHMGDEIDNLHTVPGKSHLKRASEQAFIGVEGAAEYGAQLARTHGKSFYLFDTQFRILDK